MNNYHKYLSASAKDKEWGFYVTSAGYSRVAPNENYPAGKEHPESHNFTWNKGRILDGYYVIFIAKGQGIFESALTKPETVKAGNCFFLFPGVWHRYKPDKKSGWEEYWVGFKGSYPDYIMSKEFFDAKKPVFDTGLNSNLLGTFQRLVDTVSSSYEGYHQVTAGITLQLLGLIHSITNTAGYYDDTTQLILKAKFLMKENLEKEIDILQLVKELPMGYSKFRKVFKTQTGLSPTQYHIGLRIDKAKELLATTNLGINEIANHTGFDSVFYFSRLFKQKTGASPKLYRTDGTL